MAEGEPGSGLDVASLRLALNPVAVTVVGASASRETSKNLLNALVGKAEFRFAGPVHLVSRTNPVVNGLSTVRSTADVDGSPGLVILLTQTETAVEVLSAFRECPQGVVCYAGGAESGHGAAQMALADWCATRGIPLFGPQSIGLASASASLLGLIAPLPEPIAKGGVGVVMQSGGLMAGLLRAFATRNIGLHSAVSLGNAATVGYASVVQMLLEDGACRAIAMYLEALESLPRLRELGERARLARKPMVLVVGGSTEAGRQGIASHTGSLATPRRLLDGLAAQTGMLLVSDLDELLWSIDALNMSSFLPAPGPGIGAITTSGGAAVVAADAFDRMAVTFAPPGERTRQLLASAGFNGASNPFDVGGIGLDRPEVLATAMNAFCLDDTYGIVAMLTATGLPAESMPANIAQVDRFVALVKSANKLPMLSAASPTGADTRDVARARWPGVVVGSGSHESATMLKALSVWATTQAYDSAAVEPPREAHAEGARAPRAATALLTGGAAREVLGPLGLRTPAEVTVDSADAVVQAASGLHFPLVVKTEADLAHRAVAGGVILRITTPSILMAAARLLLEKFGSAVSISEDVPHAAEYLLGFQTTQRHGAWIAFGIGGAQAGEGIEFRNAPLSFTSALELVHGNLGAGSAESHAMARAILALQAVGHANPWIASIDINPVVFHAGSLFALDAKIHLRDHAATHSS